MRILAAAFTVAFGLAASKAPSQVLSPVAGSANEKEPRQLRIVTLTRRGFEPEAIGVKPGKFTLLIRDVGDSMSAQLELLQGRTTGSVLETKKRSGERRMMEEMQFELTPGEYFLRVGDAKGRTLAIKVGSK